MFIVPSQHLKKKTFWQLFPQRRGGARVEGKSDRLSQESKSTARSHDRTNKHNILNTRWARDDQYYSWLQFMKWKIVAIYWQGVRYAAKNNQNSAIVIAIIIMIFIKIIIIFTIITIFIKIIIIVIHIPRWFITGLNLATLKVHMATAVGNINKGTPTENGLMFINFLCVA